MATPLDISGLKEFQGVFAFLFVLVFIYAVLSSAEWFKDKKAMAAMLATLMAFLTLYSPIAMKTINMMAPWFVLLIIFIVMFILVFMTLGIKSDRIVKFISDGEFAAGVWVMAVVIIIGAGSLLSVIDSEKGGIYNFAQKNVTGITGSQSSFWQTVFHPKFLGIALILLVSLFTIKYMTSNE